MINTRSSLRLTRKLTICWLWGGFVNRNLQSTYVSICNENLVSIWSVNMLHLFFCHIFHLKDCSFLNPPPPSNLSCVYVVNATIAYLQTDRDFERAELRGKDKRTYKSQTCLLNKTAKYIYIVTPWCIWAFTSWFIHLLDTDVILF
jgi:hypothetical protein